MYAEVSGLVSRFGVDPREFSLLAFGGAGPMMACFLARELGMREVVVPPTPGVLSALGGLIADLKNDFIRTLYLDLSPAACAGAARNLRCAEARERSPGCGRTRATPVRIISVYSAEMRYRGQSFELDTRARCPRRSTAGDARGSWRQPSIVRTSAIYGHADRTRGGPADHAAPRHRRARPRSRSSRAARVSSRALPSPSAASRPSSTVQRLGVRLYRRAATLGGPDLRGAGRRVTQDDCTTVVPAGIHGRGRRVRQPAHQPGGRRMSIDKATLQVLANYCAAAAESHGLDADAHRPFDLREGDRGFLLPGLTRAGLTVASPKTLAPPGTPASTTAP